MTWALRWLELPPEADERAIKRAYAQRLRLHRPDRDPEGFQRLHEAYQAALTWVHTRNDQEAADPAGTASARVADPHCGNQSGDEAAPANAAAQLRSKRPTDPAQGREHIDAQADAMQQRRPPASPGALPPAPPWEPSKPGDTAAAHRFDPARWAEEALQRASEMSATTFANWMQTQPALWSLQHKHAACAALYSRIIDTQPPIPRHNLGFFAQFFGWDDVAAEPDAGLVWALQDKLHLAWEVQPGNVLSLAVRTLGAPIAANCTRKSHTASVRSAMAQLTRRFDWAQALLAGAIPMRPKAICRWLDQIDGGRLDRLSPPIQPQQIAFWKAAGNPWSFSVPRIGIGFLRCIALSILLALLLVLDAVTNESVPMNPATVMACVGAIWASWLAWLSVSVLLRWQSDPEAAPTRAPAWLRLLCVPLLDALGLLLMHRSAARLSGTLFADLALLAAAARGIRRGTFRFGFVGWRALLVLPLLKGALGVMAGGELAAAVACTAWLWDAYRNRKALRWR
jgi:hypothetical protein